MADILTKKIKVYGIVQGVGFRPTVSRHAAMAGIAGSVSNKGSYVEIFAQGTESQISTFLHALNESPPERAVILKTDEKSVPNSEPLRKSFEIIESVKKKGEIFISPDIAVCDECRRELYDPHNRRYLHPFINCTSCGPRLTILDALPYDRDRTSMKQFPMCSDCEREYYDPASRRYDAQPVCCNDCGPQVYLAGRGEKGPDAIRAVRQVLHDGGIAAVKGIGGFHLCCDAANEEAVSRLRQLKKRPVKPFAVMMRQERTVERECRLTDRQKKILTGHQKPILLLEKRETSSLAPSVAPGNPKVGVMLPYAPVQMLLFDYCDDVKVADMLVMTSGNVSGAPIARDDSEALEMLSGFCDVILSHNRNIRIRCDDSVMDFQDGEPYMIRRSRGYAPLPVLLGSQFEGCVLAVGGELKNTFCIGIDSLFYPSSYIGDLADVRSVSALKETIGKMETLLERSPGLIACDLHPGYRSSEIAREIALKEHIPLIQIQHHYAHIVSCMAENDEEGPVIGASFDGTGYGTDGTIWGGEILRADYQSFDRLGSIRPFIQAGGDIASREGWRIAVSMLHSLYPESGIQIAQELGLCTKVQAKPVCVMADRGINSIRSTSAGRLFDAVSALLGICRVSTYEGEASAKLMFAAQSYLSRNFAEGADGCFSAAFRQYPEEILNPDENLILPTDSLFSYLVKKKTDGKDSGELAYLFHEVLSCQIAEALKRSCQKTGISTAALSGGVFQNTLLLKLTKSKLEAEGIRVLVHRYIPPNDGGICLGQAVAAAALYRAGKIETVNAPLDVANG